MTKKEEKDKKIKSRNKRTGSTIGRIRAKSWRTIRKTRKR